MNVHELNRLVELDLLESYTLEFRNDTGEDPYQRLSLVFPVSSLAPTLHKHEVNINSGVERLEIFFSPQLSKES